MISEKIIDLDTYSLLRKLLVATGALASKLAEPTGVQDLKKLCRKARQCKDLANLAFTRCYIEQVEAGKLDPRYLLAK